MPEMVSYHKSIDDVCLYIEKCNYIINLTAHFSSQRNCVEGVEERAGGILLIHTVIFKRGMRIYEFVGAFDVV